jgi:serine/threonine protein phosphatase PrpC
MKLFQRLLGKTEDSSPGSLSMEQVNIRNSSPIVGAVTDRGRVRDENEDALFALSAVISQGEELLPLSLYVVADGMGGHEGGAEASSLAVRLVADWVLDKIYQPFLLSSDQTANRQPINQVLTEAIIAANGKLSELCAPGAGTTLTCAFILGTNAFLAHVGDSRAYLIDRNSMRQITTDHSLVSRLIELGEITPEEAKTHPQRNVLYRAVGRAGKLEVDTYLQPMPTNSSLLLCSDGLWGTVPEAAMLQIITAAASPQAACRQLVAQANENGGADNITAVLVQVPD